MSVPTFYQEHLPEAADSIMLEEATSKHVIQVLRMGIGERIQLTDGKGKLMLAEIKDDHKKHCLVGVEDMRQMPFPEQQVSIAISPVKNKSRMEWFLEKATEIGVTRIYPLICNRTEKDHLNMDRMHSILISAMLQSQQVWLPVLHAPVKFNALITTATDQQKFIAHCDDTHKLPLQQALQNNATSKLLLIGPEGDFTAQEIAAAIEKGFVPVSLGNTRLRTETAGMVGATLLVHAGERKV